MSLMQPYTDLILLSVLLVLAFSLRPKKSDEDG